MVLGVASGEGGDARRSHDAGASASGGGARQRGVLLASAPEVVKQARQLDSAGTAWHAVKCGNLEVRGAAAAGARGRRHRGAPALLAPHTQPRLESCSASRRACPIATALTRTTAPAAAAAAPAPRR